MHVNLKFQNSQDLDGLLNLRKLTLKSTSLGFIKYTQNPCYSIAEVKYTLILTYLRSGSTITSRLLKTNDTFFFFEPFQGLSEAACAGPTNTFATLTDTAGLSSNWKQLNASLNFKGENNHKFVSIFVV